MKTQRQGGGRLATAWRVLRAEGWRSAVLRARDRLSERGERRRAAQVSAGNLGAAPVLNVLGLPFAARLGGVPVQLRNRLALESEDRPCAVLHPGAPGWQLEHLSRGERRRLVRGPAPLDEAVRWALEEVRASAVHCEGLAGLSVDRLGALAGEGARLLFSVHDYSFFCRRTHLVEKPHERFCEYSRDLVRCDACLGHETGMIAGAQALYRERTSALLRAAEAVVFPSAFLRHLHAELFPGLSPERLFAIEPGTPPVPGPPPARRAAVRHVAWVGSVHVHKGALVFEEVVRRLQAEGPRLRFTALGGGEPWLLARFRALPELSVRGYWRAGSLPGVLRRLGVDLALLPSVTPEAYGLTLDECWRAGVSAIAFDHGAMADRVRRLGGGLLVPPRDGAAGIARAVREAAARALPAAPDGARLPEPRHAAAAHLDLYRRLGLLPGRSA